MFLLLLVILKVVPEESKQKLYYPDKTQTLNSITKNLSNAILEL